MHNQSTVTEFLLAGFSSDHDMLKLYFVIFLFIYLIALIGNLLIIIVVGFNHHLHTPMYFFLVNLSVSDISYISTTIPKSISLPSSLTKYKHITFAGCVAQVFFVATCATSELALLTIMAYDRYVAICHPLRYFLIMNRDACIQMAVASWLNCFLQAALHTIITFRLSFCGSNMIGQYFCDISQLQKISCTDTKVNQIVVLITGIIAASFCTGFIFVSYGYIFSTVLKLPSIQSRYKALSTCIPHLIVFSLFITTAVFSYIRPKSLSSRTTDLLSAVLYTVLPPLLNPIIYSFRNRDVKAGVWKITKYILKMHILL